MLICPELNQTQTLPQYECDVYYFFDRKSETWFFNSFAKVPQDVQRTQHYHPPSGDLFERLPNELIDEIIEYLIPRSSDLLNASTAALEDYLGLGLSSARLWPLVLQRIHASYARVSMSGSWACKKVGFHSRNSTLNARQIANYNLKEPGDGRQVHRSFCRCPPCLRSHTRTDNYSGMFLSSWEWDTFASQPELKLRQLLHTAPGSRSLTYRSPQWVYVDRQTPRLRKGLGDKELDMIERDLSQSYLYPQDRVWVLRNLTTRQFIRSDQLEEPEDVEPDWDDVRPVPPVPNLEVRPSKLKRLRSALRGKWKQMTERKPAQHPAVQHSHHHQPLTLANTFLVLTSTSHNDNYAFDLIQLPEHEASGWTNISREVVADITNLCFCIRKGQEMSYLFRFDINTGVCPPTQTDRESYLVTVGKERRKYHKLVKGVVERPWVDESMYVEVDESKVPDTAPRLELVL
jgi:hypothetical protein